MSQYTSFPATLIGTVTIPGTVTVSNFPNPQAVTIASIPLPAGASTSALQVTGNASLSSIDAKLTAPLSVTGPLTDVQLRATPVPISGTVTSNAGTGTMAVSAVSLPLPAGASTSALQVSGNASLTSIDAKLTSPIAVTGAFFQGTQPISGTVTANQGTPNTIANRWPVQGSDGTNSQLYTGTGAALVDGSGVTQPVSVASLPLPTGASTSALQVSGNASLTSIDSKLTAPLAVTGTFFQATQPISAVSLPLPTGASTSALQTTGNTSLSSILTNQTNGTQKTELVDGAGLVNGPYQVLSGTNYLPVVLSSSVAPGSALPARSVLVSGSDGTNAQSLSVDSTGKLNINNISGAISLPTGAATEATLVKLPLAQASTTSGQSGVLSMGAVSASAPAYTTGQTDPLSLTTTGRLRVSDNGSYTHTSGAGTITEKSGTGVLKTVTINTRGAAGDTITIYDNTAGSGTLIASMSPGANGFGGITMHYNLNFSTGLTTVTTGTSDWTIVWQ